MTNTTIAQGASVASGAASVLGSWQICHNICLALVAGLSLLGITLTGMPLGSLAEYAVIIWSVAVVALAATIGLYLWRRCVSQGLLVLNAGLVVAGTPWLPQIVILWYILGAMITAAGAAILIKERRAKRCCA